jgi:hypothetical protein
MVVFILSSSANAFEWGFASYGGGDPCYPGHGIWLYPDTPENDDIYCYYGYELRDWPYPYFVMWGNRFMLHDKQEIECMKGIIDFLNGW